MKTAMFVRMLCGDRAKDCGLATDSFSYFVHVLDQPSVAAFMGMSSTMSPLANPWAKVTQWTRDASCRIQFYMEPFIEMSLQALHYLTPAGIRARLDPDDSPPMLT